MNESFRRLAVWLRRQPQAMAVLAGSDRYPSLSGTAAFYQTPQGVLAAVEVQGLPPAEVPCEERIFAMHIHSGGRCGGTEADPFADALSHYDPERCPHPFHAGDLPPLFASGGHALQTVLTSRFTVEEILGKTLILHAAPDDLATQPSGNSGAKIACGVIRPIFSSCPAWCGRR